MCYASPFSVYCLLFFMYKMNMNMMRDALFCTTEKRERKRNQKNVRAITYLFIIYVLCLRPKHVKASIFQETNLLLFNL